MNTTTARLSSHSTPRPRLAHRGRAALRALLALGLLMAGAAKLTGAHEMVHMFRQIGVGQWFRYLVGVLEVSGAIGLAIRPLRDIAAVAVTGLMAGATLTNLLVIHTSPAAPLTFLAVGATLAYAGRPYELAGLRRA